MQLEPSEIQWIKVQAEPVMVAAIGLRYANPMNEEICKHYEILKRYWNTNTLGVMLRLRFDYNNKELTKELMKRYEAVTR